MLKPFVLAAALLAMAAPVAAAEARATGDLPIRSGPGSGYRIIGTLPDGTYVGLSRCTRESRWCKIIYDDGPDGWVRGSYLVGSGAKLRVTPPDFVNPFRNWLD
ncbi:MAG TPA: SH3 domain-containing protein [Devosia sp.]